MSVFHRCYKWLDGLREDQVSRVPPDIRDEILAACVLLPHAYTNMRWPVSQRLSCTDATPMAGGACEVRVSRTLAETLYRITEYRGRHVRLDWFERRVLDPDHHVPGGPTVSAIVRSLPWAASRSHKFPESSHVNLQEMREIVEEVKGLGLCSNRGSRQSRQLY